VIRELLSADWAGTLSAEGLGYEFDINADTDEADKFVMDNPDPDLYTTVVELDGVKFQMAPQGDLQPGDSFQIIEVDQINGMPAEITSTVPGQTWTFNPATGIVTFGAALPGDFNGNGMLDIEDINMLTAASASGENDLTYDLNADQAVNESDVSIWAEDLFVTSAGDANLDKEFNTGDLLKVFQDGLFETGQAAVWENGDWNGDGVFGTGDLLKAFQAGTFETGIIGAVASVPEPSSLVLLLVGLVSVMGLARRR
jgi:hypothetical protein